MREIEFLKMHGLGNDFVVFDARSAPLITDSAFAQNISDRHYGIGCDQLIIIEPPRSNDAKIYMRIYNSDGSEVEACGNAVRCVGALLMSEENTSEVCIETGAGLIQTNQTGEYTTVNLGPPYTSWEKIPLSSEADTLQLDLSAGVLSKPTCVNVGNPHTVFFVDKTEDIPLEELGPILEHHPLFPDRSNIEVVEVKTKNHLRVRVWERGAGITKACGTGACAAVVAGSRRNLCNRTARVELDGGCLEIEWHLNNDVLMTGPTSISFRGIWTLKG